MADWSKRTTKSRINNIQGGGGTGSAVRVLTEAPVVRGDDSDGDQVWDSTNDNLYLFSDGAWDLANGIYHYAYASDVRNQQLNGTVISNADVTGFSFNLEDSSGTQFQWEGRSFGALRSSLSTDYIWRDTTGVPGPSGSGTVSIFIRSGTAPTRPTGGSIALNATLTPPTGWVSNSADTTGTNQLYQAQAGDTPSLGVSLRLGLWGTPFEASGIPGATGEQGSEGDRGPQGVAGESTRVDLAYFETEGGTNSVYPTGSRTLGTYLRATRGVRNFQGLNQVFWGGVVTEPEVSTSPGDYDISQISGDTGDFDFEVFTSSVTQPDTPTAGSGGYNFLTGVRTAPPGFVTDFALVTDPLNAWITYVRIIPALTFISDWSTPYPAGSQGPAGPIGVQGPPASITVQTFYTENAVSLSAAGTPGSPGDGVTWSLLATGETIPTAAFWVATRRTINNVQDTNFEFSLQNIAPNAVSALAIQANAVTTTNILDNAVNEDKIASNAVDSEELKASFVSAGYSLQAAGTSTNQSLVWSNDYAIRQVTETATTKTASFTPNLTTEGTVFIVTNNVTITMPTAATGKSFTIFYTPGTITWDSSILWSGGEAPTDGTAGRDIYVFTSDGVSWFGAQAGSEFATV